MDREAITEEACEAWNRHREVANGRIPLEWRLLNESEKRAIVAIAAHFFALGEKSARTLGPSDYIGC